MADKTGIRMRMKSIAETKKITDAMYMTSSVKMRRARREVDKTTPYFDALREEIGTLLHYLPDKELPYFRTGTPGGSRGALLVITSDKGLAGSYNHTVIREAEKRMARPPAPQLFLVGEYGRRYFSAHKTPFCESFLYSSEMPTLREAQKICAELLLGYETGAFERIDVLYTDYEAGRTGACLSRQLLPLDQTEFCYTGGGEAPAGRDFWPDPAGLLREIIPGYLTGYIYGALVDSYCNEQESRMKALQSAGENAEAMLGKLQLTYNGMRQAEITAEITEISSGAKALRTKKAAGAGADPAAQTNTDRKGQTMDRQRLNHSGTGEIAGISGPIVDVRFPEGVVLPKIREKLTVSAAGGENFISVRSVFLFRSKPASPGF